MPINLSNDLNKYKAIYSQFTEYIELTDGDKEFFDSLFILLTLNTAQDLSNKYLSTRLNAPVSTIEKRLRRLERAHLIIRYIVHFKNEKNYWTTGRTIKLDNLTFAFYYQKNNITLSQEEIKLYSERRHEVDTLLEDKERIKEKRRIEEATATRNTKRRIIHV